MLSTSLQISCHEKDVTLDLRNGKISKAIAEATPFESRISTWGEEIYFPVPIDPAPGELTTEVEVGDVAFWHEGQSLAVFFGPTPMSGDDGQPVPADDVEVVGRVTDHLDALKEFEAGVEVKVTLK